MRSTNFPTAPCTATERTSPALCKKLSGCLQSGRVTCVAGQASSWRRRRPWWVEQVGTDARLQQRAPRRRPHAEIASERLNAEVLVKPLNLASPKVGSACCDNLCGA